MSEFDWLEKYRVFQLERRVIIYKLAKAGFERRRSDQFLPLDSAHFPVDHVQFNPTTPLINRRCSRHISINKSGENNHVENFSS